MVEFQVENPIRRPVWVRCLDRRSVPGPYKVKITVLLSLSATLKSRVMLIDRVYLIRGSYIDLVNYHYISTVCRVSSLYGKQKSSVLGSVFDLLISTFISFWIIKYKQGSIYNILLRNHLEDHHNRTSVHAWCSSVQFRR